MKDRRKLFARAARNFDAEVAAHHACVVAAGLAR